MAVDVTRAFDNVDIPLLLSLVEPLLRNDAYIVLKYQEVGQCHLRFMRVPGRSAPAVCCWGWWSRCCGGRPTSWLTYQEVGCCSASSPPPNRAVKCGVCSSTAGCWLAWLRLLCSSGVIYYRAFPLRLQVVPSLGQVKVLHRRLAAAAPQGGEGPAPFPQLAARWAAAQKGKVFTDQVG